MPLSKGHGKDLDGNLRPEVPARALRELASGERLWLPSRGTGEGVRGPYASPKQEANDVSTKGAVDGCNKVLIGIL